MNFKLGELFCGPGGMALGAKLAAMEYQQRYGGALPIKHVWGVDKDPQAIETYEQNLPGDGICMDANEFVSDVEGFGKTISSYDPITGLAFGFPCNDFSSVGEQKGFQGHYGNLYMAGIRAIEKSSPLFFVAENVSGIHSANSYAAFNKIICDFENAGAGYKVTTHLYKFENYGVPQSRHRYIIVGIRKDQELHFKVPDSKPYRGCDVSCQTALKNISSELPNSEFTVQSTDVIWRLIFTPPGENAWKLDEIIQWDNKTLKAYLETIPWYEKEIAPLGRIDVIRRKIEECRLHVKTGSKMSHIYKRLVAKKPAYTITGSGGGGTHVYHWKLPRALTNRERARLQSFPDNFIFKGSKEQVRKQIGMAVPPAVAKIIFRAILDTFAGRKYPALECSSYIRMDVAEFEQYRFRRYKDRIKTRLKKTYEFDEAEFSRLADHIRSWIKQELSMEDVEAAIIKEKLIFIRPKGKK